MRIRSVFLSLILFTALTLGALAQGEETGFILFADGQRIELPANASNDEMESFFMELIDSAKDGRCEIQENGKTTFQIDKVGDQITATFEGQSETMTVAEAKKNFAEAKAQGLLTACKSNQKNIATGLEMWAVDHEGKYPTSLAELTPDYLKMVPHCPVSDTDTYSSTYQTLAEPKNYEFHCTGDHSGAGVAPGLPGYNGVDGLIEADQ